MVGPEQVLNSATRPLSRAHSSITLSDASNYMRHPYKKVGAQGGTRTHRIYHLEIACMPIPSQAQKRSSDLGVLDDKS
jgi:hypothetical protein